MVGAKIQELRQARHWTREKLAGEAGVSLSTIVRAENEDRTPRGENLVAIADAFGVTLDELFGRDTVGPATGRYLKSPQTAADQRNRRVA